MDIPKNGCRRIESGVRGCPAKRVRVYPRRTGAATECGPNPGPEMTGNPKKWRKNNAPCAPAQPRTDCLIAARAYLGIMTVHFPFEHTYAALPASFFARVAPTPVAAPRLVKLNRPLAKQLGLD